MAVPFPSALIRYERLRRNWSLEGLCEGICAVSYLSKIELGKAEPGEEILSALMNRLELEWYGGKEAEEAKQLADELLEALLSVDGKWQNELLDKLEENRTVYLHGPHMLQLLLLAALCENRECFETDLSPFEDCFSPHQRALWLMGQRRYEEALPLFPMACTYLGSGGKFYEDGQYTQAVERLLQANAVAAEEGRVRVMLQARVLLGNCYSDLNDYQAMRTHYQAAERIAQSLGLEEMLEGIRYNTAVAQMVLGMYAEALQYYRSIESPYPLALHKMAICQEKLGMTQEALASLDRIERFDDVDWPPHPWLERMCALVRYRLEHLKYLRDAAYGEMLLDLYQGMQKELPYSIVLFHQPWVEEWYVATRQYKQAYELKKKDHFPDKIK